MTPSKKLRIHDMAGHLIRRLNQISTSVFKEKIRSEGFDVTSVQYATLQAISACPGLDQASLANLIAYDKATIGGVLDRLESKGYVSRVVCERDRRARELSLTTDGEATLAELKPIVCSLQDEVLRGLDTDEKREFLRLADKAAAAGNELSRAPMNG